MTGSILRPLELDESEAQTQSGDSRRWSVTVPLLATLGLVGAGLLYPGSEPEPAPRSFSAERRACQITDERLGATSGLAVRGDDVWVVDRSEPVLYRLDEDCEVARTVDLTDRLTEAGVSSTDIEDLAATADGWLWLADTGAGSRARSTIRVIGYRDNDTPLRIAKLTYPDGAHDAEALAIDLAGRALVVTRVTADKGPSEVYVTPASLTADPDQELRALGDLTIPRGSDTDADTRRITGATVDPSGTRVLLRTYANAWEWTAPDGDLATAIMTTRPQRIDLPKADRGAALAFTVDGRTLLTTGKDSPVDIDRMSVEVEAR